MTVDHPAVDWRESPRPPSLGPVDRIGYRPARSVLTPASGFIAAYDYTLNPYSGCGFGCEYCYAQFFAPTDEQRESWGEWVQVKENAFELIERAIARDRLRPGDAIYMSSVTDPCQPLEARLGLTSALLVVMTGVQPRLTIQTRSPIVARDVDLLAQFERVRVNFSIPTDSEEVRLRYEPHAPAISVRLRTAESLVAAGVPIGITISPMLPMAAPTAFGKRIAALGAVEYVATGFHRPAYPTRFVAATGEAALDRARAEGWTKARYEAARAAIATALAPRQLLKGDQGFAPAQ